LQFLNDVYELTIARLDFCVALLLSLLCKATSAPTIGDETLYAVGL